ncbi:MAG: TatD family hydrolase [Armatimonadota bacterium]|nr:TatD family hydrolase [Armatimonadota bacterium]
MIDTHTHLNDPKFEQDLDEVIQRAKSSGVDRMIVCGYDIPSSRAAVEIARKHEGVFATVGVHPHEAATFSADTLRMLRELAQEPRVVAVGETGLDFYYSFSPWPQQEKAFAHQIELALELDLPIVVHSRLAGRAVLEIIDRYQPTPTGVFHCFSESKEIAQTVTAKGFFIGIDGPITFKPKKQGTSTSSGRCELQEIVRIVPLTNIVVETDCPYLTPVPYRGRRNEPAYLVYIVEELARTLGRTIEEIDRITSENAERLFPRMIEPPG